MLNIAVFCSGGGTNLQALIDAERRGEIKNGKLSLVIASKDGILAIERAKNANIPALVVQRAAFPSRAAYDEHLCRVLKSSNVELIVLAGFLEIVGQKVLSEYKNKILNVHPSLIPSFCGLGCYGLKVHEMALARGVKVTGATVHFVDEVVDGGQIVLQKAVEVREGDTPESLQKRVMEEAEHLLLPQAVSLFCEGKIKIR